MIWDSEVRVARAEDRASVPGGSGAWVATGADERFEIWRSRCCEVCPVFDEGEGFADGNWGGLEAVEEVEMAWFRCQQGSRCSQMLAQVGQ